MAVLVPPCQAEAGFFRMLGHPVRIRVPELPRSGAMAVREPPAESGGEPAVSREAEVAAP